MVNSEGQAKKPIDYRGWLGLALIIIFVVYLSFFYDDSASSSSSSSTHSSSSSSSADPIEQARVVLGGKHSYEHVKRVTDNALAASGLSLTDSNRSKAWSAVIAVDKDERVDRMAVMECVPSLKGRVDLPAAVTSCYLELVL